ncbi:MAG: diacylglycerol kinase family lipid kinase [Porphyromonas sp.]|nr:diacylglycerol kinase family lipid kinase [Porphyromonas sp.]
MKYLLIANPISGTKKDIAPMIHKVEERIVAEGHEVSLQTTEHEGHGYQLAQEALDSDYDVIVAVGGDGTVNEVAHALVGSDKILGVVPNGSGNGLARELLIPMDAKAATDTLLRHSVATIDTCTVNGTPFFVTCGIGFDAKISKEFARSESRGIRTYAKEAITQFFNYEPKDYHLLIDGREVTATAFLVAVANASQYGNNAFIAPTASMVDGLLDVTILKSFPNVEAPKIAFQLFTKDIDNSEFTSLYKGKEIIIQSATPVNYHIDGEPMPKAKELEIKINPHSLNVLRGEKEDRVKSAFEYFNAVTHVFSDFASDVKDYFN